MALTRDLEDTTVNTYLLETARSRYQEAADQLAAHDWPYNGQGKYALAYLGYLAGVHRRRPDPLDYWPIAVPATRARLAAESRTAVVNHLGAMTRMPSRGLVTDGPLPARDGAWTVEPDSDYPDQDRWRVTHTTSGGGIRVGNLDRRALSDLWDVLSEVLADGLED